MSDSVGLCKEDAGFLLSHCRSGSSLWGTLRLYERDQGPQRIAAVGHSHAGQPCHQARHVLVKEAALAGRCHRRRSDVLSATGIWFPRCVCAKQIETVCHKVP